MGSGGADGGDCRAGVSAVRAADGGRVHLPVPPEGLQPQAEAGGGGHVLRPPSTWPRTRRCRISSTICPRLAPGQVSASHPGHKISTRLPPAERW